MNAIADAALGLLAERGMRGLTHRAVDEAAGLPQGSTSNRARTRSALLEVAVRRLAARELELLGGDALGSAEPTSAEGLAALLAAALHRSLTEGRELARARFELALEAARRPELRTAYDAEGRGFRELLRALLAGVDAPEPERQSQSLVSWCEGTLFYAITGASAAAPPTEEQLRTGAAEVLRGMLGK